MGTILICKEVVISGRKETLHLPEDVWSALDDICRCENLDLHRLFSLIDEARGYCRLDAATSFFVLTYRKGKK